jgi:hypothetical protein
MMYLLEIKLMIKTLVVVTGEDYPRGKSSGRTVFFFEGVFNNNSLWSMTMEMPEPGFPPSWEVLLVNIKKTLLRHPGKRIETIV